MKTTVTLMTLTLMLSSCSSMQDKNVLSNKKRLPSSTEFLKNDKEVSLYIQAMKTLGTDGSISFSSSWTKQGWFKNNTAIITAEVQDIAKTYQSKFDNKIMESKLAMEEKDVCEKFVIYKTEEEKLNILKTTSATDRNFKMELSTAASASAAGLVGLAGVIGSDGLGAGARGGGSVGIGGFFNGDLNYKSNTKKSSESVDYYYVKNGVICGKYVKYARATITLTPDLFSLHPQQSAELIYDHVSEKLDTVEKLTGVLHQSISSIIDNPIYDMKRFKENFSSFLITSLMNQNQVAVDAGLDIFARDLGQNIGYVRQVLKSMKANRLIVDNFSDRIEVIENQIDEAVGFLASLENTQLAISLNNVKKVVLNENQIAKLNGKKLSSELKNYSIVFPSREKMLQDVLDVVLSQDVLITEDRLSDIFKQNLNKNNGIEFLVNSRNLLTNLGFSHILVNGDISYSNTVGGIRDLDYHKKMMGRGCILNYYQYFNNSTFKLSYLCASTDLITATQNILYKK